MSPTTSPMRVAALPSSDMASTVRPASLTAREATCVERVACSAISAIEAASSSTEPAAAVTLPEATPTRCSALRASAETSSAALLSWVAVTSRRCAASRTLASAWSTEVSKRAMVAAMSAPLAFAAGGGLARGEPLALEHGVAEHQDGARHRAKLVMHMRGRDAHRGVAGRELRHRLAEPVERPCDTATDPPAESKPHQHRHGAHPADELLGARLRGLKRRRRRAGA